MEQLNKQWKQCLDIIQDNLNRTVFDTWFAPLVPVSFKDKELVLQVPSQFYYEYIEEKYLDLLSKVLYKVFGEGVRLRYKILVDRGSNETIDYSGRSTQTLADNHENCRGNNPFGTFRPADVDPQLNFDLNFDEFLPGQSNQLARSAGLSVAKNPGKTFNPMFIYGPSGVGKTHLANAIGVAAKANNPSLRVLYVSSNTFQLQFTNAVRQSSVNDFINFYQTIDLLIIDDVQQIIGKKSTQNTFFNIFNHLHQMHKQIVLTSDRMPTQFNDIEERLLTRFKWGLVAELERPDTQLRRDILKHKIYKDGIHMSEEVVDYIAENVSDNVRDLEGAIVSILAQSTFRNVPVDLSLADKVVANLVTVRPMTITLEQIRSTVCEYFNIDEKDIQTNSRKKEIVIARQIAMYLSKQYTNNSLNAIGNAIGKRNHATVSHALQAVKNQLETDRDFKAAFNAIETKLRNRK